MGYGVAVKDGWGAGTGWLVRDVADTEYGASGPAVGGSPADISHETSGAESEGSGGAPGAGEDLDPEAVDALGDEIATLAAHAHVVIYQLLARLGPYDRTRGWERAGHLTCAHWLSFRTGYDLGTAREYVRVARALESLPQTGRSMSEGRLSFSQVRALTRVATPENESDLLELAEGATVTQLERMVRAWRKYSRLEEADWERARHESRKLSVFPDDDGMYVVHGRLDPEVGVLLMRAIEAASDALYRERKLPPEAEDTAREAARRRADAVGLVAERALAAGFGGKRGEKRETPDAEPDSELDPLEDGSACGCGRGEAPISGTRAARYQVVLHVDADTLRKDGEPGRSELEDGTRISCETSRRLACDASVVRVTHGPDGSVLDVGRKTRSTPPALRRALEVRDRGCRFPGCGRRFTDSHHVEHWGDGGPTSLANTLLLCGYHHRLVHEGGWTVEWIGDGLLSFYDPEGQQGVMEGGRPPPRIRDRHKLPDSLVEKLLEHYRLQGIKLGPHTAGARWKRERDIPDQVYFRATGAV